MPLRYSFLSSDCVVSISLVSSFTVVVSANISFSSFWITPQDTSAIIVPKKISNSSILLSIFLPHLKSKEGLSFTAPPVYIIIFLCYSLLFCCQKSMARLIQPSATVPSPNPNPWESPVNTSISALVPFLRSREIYCSILSYDAI